MVAPVFNNSEPLTVDEIERLPRWAAVALAARCAMRISPIIGISGKLHYWRTEASANATAIELVPFQVAFSSVSGTDQSLHIVKSIVARAGEKAEAANAMAEAAAVAACSRAAAASIAAAGKGAAVTRAATAAAVRATDVRAATAAREGLTQIQGIDHRAATAAARAIQSATKSDCQLLFKLIGSNTDDDWCAPLDFYEMPLWPEGNLPEGWNQLLSMWEEALSQINQREIYERHLAWIQGGAIAWDQMETRLQSWVESLSQTKTEEPHYSKPVDYVNESDLDNEPEQAVEQKSQTQSKERGSDLSGRAIGENLDIAPSETQSASGPALPLSDAVASNDILDRESLISSLGALLASPRQRSPFTLGIFGNWGSGKSSVLAQVKQRLSHRPYKDQFDFATFSPWENRHSDSIQTEIVKSIVSGLTNKVDRKSRLKLMWDFIRHEPKQMVYKGLIALCFYLVASFGLGIVALALNNPIVHAVYGVTFLSGLGLFIWQLWKQIQPAFEQALPFPVSLRIDLPKKEAPQTISSADWKQQLKTLCELRLRSQNPMAPRRLVLLIDDIDRCASDVIVETFDSIQLIADLPGIITIVATDDGVAMQAIAEQYREVADETRSASVLARNYLGKLFQASIALNNPSRATIRKFVETWLFPEAGESSHRQKPEASVQIPETQTQSQSESSSPLYNKLVEDPALSSDSGAITIEQVLQIDMRDTNRDKSMFIDLADLFEINNPRQLIRLRNSYRLAKAFNRIRRYDENLTEFGLSKIMTLMFWEEYLRTQTTETREFAQVAIHSNDQIDKASFAIATIDGINRIRDVFDLSSDDESMTKVTEYNKLNEFVNQFLLPYTLSPETTKTESESQPNNDSKANESEEMNEEMEDSARLMKR